MSETPLTDAPLEDLVDEGVVEDAPQDQPAIDVSEMNEMKPLRRPARPARV